MLDNVTVVNNLTIEGDAALSGTTTVFSGAAGSPPGMITIGNSGQLDYVGAGPATLDNNIALANGELGWMANFATVAETVDATVAAGVAITGEGAISDNYPYLTTVTLTNAGTIDANVSGGDLRISTDGFDNSGLMQAGTGATLAVLQNQTAVAWTNSGTISGSGATEIVLGGALNNTGLVAVNGGSLIIGDEYQTYDPTTEKYSNVYATWTNTGTIDATNASLLFEGDETVGDLGTITRSGGALYFVGGTLDDTGVTLDGSQADVVGLQLSGGTIEGGAILAAPLGFGVGGADYADTASGLDDVTVIGGFGVSGQLNVIGTTFFYADASKTIPSAITVDSGGVLAFAKSGPQTLDNGIALVGGTLTWSLIQNEYSGTITDIATIATGDAVTGYGEIEDNRSGYIDSLTNDGTIIADYSFENLTIGVATFDNQDLLEGTDSGTLTIGISRYIEVGNTGTGALGYLTFINTGTIEANHGVVVLAGDETVADLGLIENIAGTLYYGGGTLDNIGGTLNAADTSLLGIQMFGAEIEGGTLDQGALQLGFVSGTTNTLDNVAVINNLTLSGTVVLTGSSAIYGDAAASTPGMVDVTDGALEFVGAGPFTLTNNVALDIGYIDWSSDPSVPAVSTVTIAPGVLVDGAGQLADISYFGQGGTDDVTNLGTLEATGFDATFSVIVATFTNSATLIAGDAATFTVNSPDFTNLNNGTLTGGTYISDSEATFSFEDGAFNSITITADAADIVLTGTAAFSSLESTLTSVAASGIIEADDGASFGGTNTLSVAGTVLLGGGTLSETNIELLAGATLSGHGEVFATGGLTLDASITASGGVLELDAPVTGAGTVEVAAASAVQFDDSTGQAVSLNGADGAVVLGAGVQYSGTLHGFAAGDLLIIDGFEGSSASYADNHVVVSNATASVTVDIVGNFATDAFSATVPVTGETAVQLVQGPTLSVTAPTSELDNPGTVIAISGVTLTDGVGATVTVDISDQYGVLSATVEGGGIAQGNGTGSLVLSGALAAVNAELKTLQYRAPGVGQPTDTIVVNATDDTSGMATGLIDVTIDQPPTIALPAAAFEPVGTVASLAGLGLTKPDPFAGEILSITLSDQTGLLAATVSGSGTVTGSGSTLLVLTGSLADVNTEMGSVTFDGTVDDQLTISADDGRGGIREGFVPVYVNLPPVISAPGTAAAIFGATIPVPGVSITDPYGVAAGDLFTVTLTDTAGTLTTTAVAGASVGRSGTGTLTLVGTLSSINSELSSIDYTAGSAASDNIVVSVSDGHGENSGVTIDMAVAADVPPTTKVPATAVVTALSASTLGALTVTDSDAIATSKVFTVVISDNTGTLSATAEPGGVVSGKMSDRLTLTGDLAVINSELASVQYTGAVPGQAANATATDTVALQTTDGYGGSNTQDIAVTIDQVPYAPPGVSAPASAALQAGTAITLGTITVADSFAQVTGATLDVSVSDLTGTLDATASGGGRVIGNGSSQLLLTGDLASVNAELASLIYTGAPPNTALGETAADTVFVQAQDGRGGASTQQQIAVTVSPSGTQPYDAFLTAVNALTTQAEANPNSGPALTAATLAVYVASVSGAIGSVGGTVWQGAYDASGRAAGTVGADIVGPIAPAQLLSDSFGLFDSVVAGTLGAIAANGPQSAYDAIEAAALALTADVSAGSNTKLLTDLSTLYGAIAAAAGGTLSQTPWQTAYNGSTSAANALATAVSDGATNATLLADAAALFDTVISGSLTAIGGNSLEQAYSTGGTTIGTLASDISGGAASQQILGDLSNLYNVVITGAVGAGVAVAGVTTNAGSSVSATALSNYTIAFGASAGLLTTIAGNGSVTDIYNSTRSVFISTLPSGLGSLNGPGVQSGLNVVTTLETALAAYVAAKPPSSQDANLSAVGTSFLTSVFGKTGNADWTQYTDTVNQTASTDGPAITGQTAQAASAESDFLDKVITSIFTLAEAQSSQAATAIDTALNTTLTDENAGNGSAILADVGKLFSALTTAAASSTGSINADANANATVTTADSSTFNADINAFVNANITGLTGVLIDFGVPAVVLFIPSLAGIVPAAALLGAALLAYGIVDFGMRALPPGNPYGGTWNNLKRNPFYTLTHPFGSGHGDTHLTTYDGLYYNFQAAGEFVLSKSTVVGDSFQVQIRLQPWSTGSTVSVITQAAVAIGTADKLTFDSTRNDPVYFDGSPLTLTTGVVKNLGAATVEQVTAGSWQVQYATGESVSINQFGGYLDVDAALAGNTPPGSTEGLLGNDGGNPQDDLMLPNGTVLQQPVSSAQLYTTFADAWRVTAQSSLLDYGAGQSTTTFTDPSFPSDAISLSSLPAAVLENAASLVAAAGITNPAAAQGAIEDYLLTGDTSFIAADAASQNVEQPTLVAAVTPGTTSVALGIGVVTPEVTLATTGTVTPVAFTVYLTGAEATAETVTYAVQTSGNSDLGATAFAGDVLPTGSVTIAAGQVSTRVAVDVLNTALGVLPTATLELGITSTDGTPVAAPDASVGIANSQPVAGTPAIPAFVDVSNVGTLRQSGTLWTLDLGNYYRDTVFSDVIVDIANAATGTADVLSGPLTSGAGSAISFSSDLAPVRSLLPGAVDPLTVEFDTTQLGTYDTQLVLAANDSNASGYSAPLGNITLDVTGDVMACFLMGTRILTNRGEVVVEALRAGDLVVTLSGRGPVLKPLTWIGTSPVDLDRHPAPAKAAPIHIRENAFGAGAPHRDLLVSPDHAIAVASSLVPAYLLVNGATILREPAIGAITYFHVELARHDILLADGLPAESYLDTGNRAVFANAGVARRLHPNFTEFDPGDIVRYHPGRLDPGDRARQQPTWGVQNV